MKLYIKEKLFSFTDQFAVRDHMGDVRYFVQGELFSWGKKLHVYDAYQQEVALVKQEVLTFLPTYAVYHDGREIARIKREFTFFRPRYTVEGLGWDVEGNFWTHEYLIRQNGVPVVSISREWMSWGDSYELDIAGDANEIVALAVVLAIDCVMEQANDC